MLGEMCRMCQVESPRATMLLPQRLRFPGECGLWRVDQQLVSLARANVDLLAVRLAYLHDPPASVPSSAVFQVIYLPTLPALVLRIRLPVLSGQGPCKMLVSCLVMLVQYICGIWLCH